MTAVVQPFMRINPPKACLTHGRHAVQIVPVAGNRDRLMPVFVVQHGPRHYLTHDGRVTTTPVWMAWGEAAAADLAHVDAIETRSGADIVFTGGGL